MSASRTQLKMNTSGKAMDGVRKQAGSPADTTQKKQSVQKAWTGSSNPITQKSPGSNAPNGTANAARSSVPTKTTQAQVKGSSSPDKQANDTTLYLLANFIGTSTTLMLKGGEQFNGIFAGVDLDVAEPHYILKMVKRIQNSSGTTNGTMGPSDDYLGTGEDHLLTFPLVDVVDLVVSEVTLDKPPHRAQNGVATSSFRTDADISGNLAVRERDLQPWQPGVDTSIDLALDESGSAGWNQFEANERLYGVKSSYDENLYTTTIDRSDPNYTQKAAKAEKLAREIEGSSAMNAHVAEERGGRATDDLGLDEEDKYSGVKRDFPPLQSGQPNKYTPPARRAPTGQATVPGAPVDPAIISSQLSKPAPPANTAEPHSAASAAEQSPKGSMATSQQAELRPSTQENVKQVATAPATVKDASGTTEQKLALSSTNKPSLNTTPGRQYGQGQNATENVERNLLGAFKEFSASEKMKIMDRQRAQRSNDKAVKLNDLKKFSQNFKLYTPVPTDLVPILAKDKNKQDEIMEKAARQAREQEARKSTAAGSETTSADQKVQRGVSAAINSPNPGLDRTGDRVKQMQNFNGQSVRGNKMQSYGMQPIPGPRENRQPGLAQRLQMNQQQHKAAGVMPSMPAPLPLQEMRIPSGPSGANVQSNASLRGAAKPFEFRPNPAASTFTPIHPSTGSSPRMESAAVAQPKPSKAGSFFGGKKPRSASERPSINDAFNPIKRMKKETEENGKTKDFASNGGIPNAYRTPPTWDVPPENQEKKYIDMFEKAQVPVPAVSPMHSSPASAPMAHQHQLPLHLQQNPPGVPTGPTPQHTPRNFPAQPNMGPGVPHFDDHRMQFSHSQSSVQRSPRFAPPILAYPNMPPQMQQTYGQPMHAPYGMSPGNHHVQYRPAPQPPFVHPQNAPMGGHMMVQQPSGGPFMPGMQIFTPVPPGPQQHYGGPPPSSGYPSPRPTPMSHQGSQQGHGPPQPVIYMQAPQHSGPPPPMMYPQHPGAMTPMRGYPPQPHYTPSPHQQPQYPMPQHRGGPSGNYQHMGTPHMIQQQGPPPVMAAGPMAGHGDENK